MSINSTESEKQGNVSDFLTSPLNKTHKVLNLIEKSRQTMGRIFWTAGVFGFGLEMASLMELAGNQRAHKIIGHDELAVALKPFEIGAGIQLTEAVIALGAVAIVAAVTGTEYLIVNHNLKQQENSEA